MSTFVHSPQNETRPLLILPSNHQHHPIAHRRRREMSVDRAGGTRNPNTQRSRNQESKVQYGRQNFTQLQLFSSRSYVHTYIPTCTYNGKTSSKAKSKCLLASCCQLMIRSNLIHCLLAIIIHRRLFGYPHKQAYRVPLSLN